MVSSVEVKSNENLPHSSPRDSSSGKGRPLNPDARNFVPRHYYSQVIYGPPIPPPIPAPLPPVMQMPAICPIMVPFNVHFNCCPVVYPNRYGRPGTVYYMDWNQVPASAIPIAVWDGNGGYRTHFFNNIREYC